jgi:hypothetical protein
LKTGRSGGSIQFSAPNLIFNRREPAIPPGIREEARSGGSVPRRRAVEPAAGSLR